MKILETPFNSLKVVETQSHEDERGSFSRYFCTRELENLMDGKAIVNMNHSLTHQKGAIRGLHFQHPPHAEIKAVRCIKGGIYDVAVDLRQNSPTFLKWFGLELTHKNKKMLIVPEGFAHGFQALQEDSEVLYLVTTHYSKENEEGLNPLDPTLDINWPLEATVMSEKDQQHPFIASTYTGVSLAS